MTSISLLHLIVYSIAVSAGLTWLNMRGIGILGAAAGTVVVCVVIALLEMGAFGSPSRGAAEYWWLFVLLPSAVVFAVSRLGILQRRAWGLLLLGPLTFVVAVIAVMVVYNILFATVRHQGYLGVVFSLPVRVIYLVESPFTVLKFWQMGLPAVSPFGWSLSEQQIAIVAELAKCVICLPDRDKQEAFAPYAHQLSKRVWVRCPEMPEGVEDPESLTLEEVKSVA